MYSAPSFVAARRARHIRTPPFVRRTCNPSPGRKRFPSEETISTSHLRMTPFLLSHEHLPTSPPCAAGWTRIGGAQPRPRSHLPTFTLRECLTRRASAPARGSSLLCHPCDGVFPGTFPVRLRGLHRIAHLLASFIAVVLGGRGLRRGEINRRQLARGQ